MRVIGIDPGLHITGYGVIDIDGSYNKVFEAGVIRTNQKDNLEVRLGEIALQLKQILNQFEPEVMAVEELYSHYNHPRTSIIMGHARGVILLQAAESKIPLFQYASTRIKKSITGNGRAPKNQMQLMVQSLLSLKTIPDPPDVADALATAICHARTIEQLEEVGV